MTTSQPINDIHEHNNETASDSTLNPIIVLERIKELLGLATDADLARCINEPPKTIGTWKYRNALPYKKLIPFCVKQNMDLNYIFAGFQKRPLAECAGHQELIKVIDETTSVWGELDTISRYELASKILRTLSEYKTTPD